MITSPMTNKREIQTTRLYNLSQWMSGSRERQRGQLEPESARFPHSALRCGGLQVTGPCAPGFFPPVTPISSARPGAYCLRLHLQTAASSVLTLYLPWALTPLSLMLSRPILTSRLPPSLICHRHYSVTMLRGSLGPGSSTLHVWVSFLCLEILLNSKKTSALCPLKPIFSLLETPRGSWNCEISGHFFCFGGVWGVYW